MSSLFKIPSPPPTKPGRDRQLSPLSGAHVSPIALGSMSIGDKWEPYGMGAMTKETSFALLDAFYDAGGNFIDTANNYQDESSEAFVGEWMEQRGICDQMVIAAYELTTGDSAVYYATDYKRGRSDIKQHSGYVGNHVKSLHISVEQSLKKLRTSYIDILCVHWWDYTSSIEEVINGLHALVLAGKVLYLNVLAAGRIRTDEEERRRLESGEKGRLLLTDEWRRNETERKVAKVLEEVATEVGAKSIQAVAIAYAMQKVPYVSPIIGGRKVEHLHANLQALEITLTDEHFKRIESAVPCDLGLPTNILTGHAGRRDRLQLLIPECGSDDPWPLRQAIRPSPSQ
ncbi:aryl-alcohol dehydrogenase [Trametes elegans]|nr:aryl-alcohol dehydrogenase [Trametes elegans]